MDKIYSEADVTQPGLSWGEWRFSLSEDNIQERISSISSRSEIVDHEDESWDKLFSILKKSSNVNQPVSEINMSVTDEDEIENSTICDDNPNENVGVNCQENVQNLSSAIVDTCNRLVPILKTDPSAVYVESELFVNDLSKLSKDTLVNVMQNAWSQISTEESRLCFFTLFPTVPLCICLCENILVPWLSVNHSSKLELLSSILCKQGETVCVNLIAPLLKTEDSPWVRDLPGVEELMSAMTVHHWNILLKELLSGMNELQEWQIPVLSAVVGKAAPSYQELLLLVQLMSSASTVFNQNRDFGALVAAVASSLTPDSASLGPQLKAIVNNFKGSLKVMKFKTLKIIADISD